MKNLKKSNKKRIVKKKNISDKDMEIILNVLLDEVLGEDSTKKERNNKISKIIDKLKENKCKASISKLCNLFHISRSRFYDRKINVGYKKRRDSKSIILIILLKSMKFLLNIRVE
ncbi:UNVERIFIED_CONTAM: hypothetical protein O8I53_08415 [Campylobacter lari]